MKIMADRAVVTVPGPVPEHARAKLASLAVALALPFTPASAATPGQAPSAAEPVSDAPAAATAAAEGIQLNFQQAPLADVLNYLSEAAGLVIVQEAPVQGTVNVISHQPIFQEDVVDLLNAVLVEKGYAAIRNGRILKIVDRRGALTRDVPVRRGSTPDEIPRNDEIVTQILPVRYADAAQLVNNLTELLPEEASLTANESSNAIVLTDTQANIRRMAEIITALDTSITAISAIRVFPLEFADATELAEVIGDLFEESQSSRSSNRSQRDRFRMGPFGDRGGPPGQNDTGSNQSEAREAATRVVAVADERTNSLIVSAPEDLMPTIEQIVADIDTNIADITEVRVFKLENSDALELADVINELYQDDDLTSSNQRGGRSRFFGGPGGPPGSQQQRDESRRSLVQSRVIAVGDPRTNALLVSASSEMMLSIAEVIGRLDASSERKQRVYVYPLEHADVDNVAGILRGMFEDTTTTGRSRSTRGGTETTTRLTERSSTGASTEVSNSFGSRSNSRGGSTGR